MYSSLLTAVVFAVICCVSQFVDAEVMFSSLQENLIVSASPKQGQVLKAGEDSMTVSWMLNGSLAAGVDTQYKFIKIKLCYGPISQVDRGWRKTRDDLKTDKTCQFNVGESITYVSDTARMEQTVDYTVSREVPTAVFFVRAYVLDSDGKEVAYGQSTDSKKTTNLFEVKGISGRNVSLDIAATCFSAFSLLSMAGFYIADRRRKNK